VFNLSLDANTIGSIAALASIDWGAAVQIMAAITIGTNGDFEVTRARLLQVVVLSFHLLSADQHPLAGFMLPSSLAMLLYVALEPES